ncbi:MAG: hypothetical protein H6668_10980 [Ardenticatenaceae bacterium]|nr:hypothetical protein [Ardenticatenaceae bacterium]
MTAVWHHPSFLSHERLGRKTAVFLPPLKHPLQKTNPLPYDADDLLTFVLYATHNNQPTTLP